MHLTVRIIALQILNLICEARGPDVYDIAIHVGAKQETHRVFDRHLDFYATESSTGAENILTIPVILTKAVYSRGRARQPLMSSPKPYGWIASRPKSDAIFAKPAPGLLTTQRGYNDQWPTRLGG
jgi:hypothetical protein